MGSSLRSNIAMRSAFYMHMSCETYEASTTHRPPASSFFPVSEPNTKTVSRVTVHPLAQSYSCSFTRSRPFGVGNIKMVSTVRLSTMITTACRSRVRASVGPPLCAEAWAIVIQGTKKTR